MKKTAVRIPRRPPSFQALFEQCAGQCRLGEVLRMAEGPLVAGTYLHWEKLRFRDRPTGLELEEWWLGLKLHRRAGAEAVPLVDRFEKPFSFGLPAPLPERLHWLDSSAGGTIRLPGLAASAGAERQILDRSLIEEAFTSSQLEGAGTTRERAKAIIRMDAAPRDRGDKMVLNNYRAMQHILTLRDEPLSRELVFEIQRIVTDGTLDDPDAAGRFRRNDEYRVVGDHFGEVVYHEPPEAKALDRRMEQMCAFANSETPQRFLHPVIRSMILHFCLAYDHPFVDGNGRTARALFYWSMLRHGYWLFEFVSISSVILKGPMQYERAFLETETDDNDLTYFLLYHADVIARAVEELHAYIQRKTQSLRKTEAKWHWKSGMNRRQRMTLVEAMRNPRETITVESHRRMHGVVTQTARTDLIDLVDRGLLRMEKVGRAFEFRPVPDLEERLKKPTPPPQA